MVAPPGRFELPTCGLQIRFSIRLRYEGYYHQDRSAPSPDGAVHPSDYQILSEKKHLYVVLGRSAGPVIAAFIFNADSELF